MNHPSPYLIRSERLGFRHWVQEDLEGFAELNSDPEVMAHFPKLLTPDETKAFMVRLHEHHKKWGYTYFAVDHLESDEFIGFIGLAYKDFPADFTPCVDIGWRLKRSAWGYGLATEGAECCLKFAFHELALERIVATCTVANTASENVMKKIGMTFRGRFAHPNLKDFPYMQECVWYEIDKAQFKSRG